MSLTLEDLKEKLMREDEVTLLEILEINSEDLVERFDDKIELKWDQLIEEYEEDEDDDDDEME